MPASRRMARIAGCSSGWIVSRSSPICRAKRRSRSPARDELDQCRWVCVDADAPDGLAQLRLVQQALEAHGLPSLLEQSRRGGHLWLFFTLPQPASLATGVVQGVLDPLYASGQLPHVLEVYPDHTELGHAVRMPLGIHRRTGQRYPFLDQGWQPHRPGGSAGGDGVRARPARDSSRAAARRRSTTRCLRSAQREHRQRLRHRHP